MLPPRDWEEADRGAEARDDVETDLDGAENVRVGA